jgi:hypothetical protein
MRICGTTQRQFRDFQIHFVEQRFGSPGKVVHFAGHTKFPSLLQKLIPEFCHAERLNRALPEANRIARTTANPRTLGRKKDETLGADRAIPVRLPEHLACKGAEEFFAAAYQVPGTGCASVLGRPLAIPTFVSEEITEFRPFEAARGQRK